MKRIIIAIAALLLALQGAQAQLPQLSPLKDMKGDLHPAFKNGKWGYANSKNKFIIKAVFDAAENFMRVGASDGTVLDVAKIRIGQKWGYVSREGIYFIEPTYDAITDFDIHSVAFALRGGSYIMFGVTPAFSINLGERVLKPVELDRGFNEAVHFSFKGIALARKEGKYGILKSTGKWLVPADNDRIVDDQTFKMYRLERDGLIGYSTYVGEIVFPVKFKSLNWFADKIVLANNGKVGLYRADGSVIIPVEYDAIDHFESNLRLEKDGKAGLATMDGKMIIPVEYDAIELMSNGNFMVKGADGYNVYGPDCVALFPTSFDSLVLDPVLGYLVEKDGLYGRLDDHGKYMYPCVFETVPDPEQKGYVELMVDGEPYIFLAGESAPRKVSDYDDALYRQMSDRSYAASPLLPAWLKGHMGRGRIEKKVLMEGMEYDWVSFYDDEARYNNYRLKCGKTLSQLLPYDIYDMGVEVCDLGGRVYLFSPEVEMFGTLYAYDDASSWVSTHYMGDATKVYDFTHGFAAETYGAVVDKKVPVARFYNLNPGMASTVLVCYTFHSWAGVVEVAVCPTDGNDFTVVTPGATISLEPEYEYPKIDPLAMGFMDREEYIKEMKIGDFDTFEMFVHEPAENGIALYEVKCKRHFWRVSRGVAREVKVMDLQTVAYGYIGLGCDYFVQPLFLDACEFEGDKARVRVGENWLSLTAAEIAAYDPFVQPL